jgi:Ala-tRNA(Pro) deacylase
MGVIMSAPLSQVVVEAGSRLRLFERFALLGVDAPTLPYPRHKSIEEGKRLRGEMTGTFTKNLLLRDKKARLFLFSIHEDRELDLRSLHTRVGGNGRLGFATSERIGEVLGVVPGALTPLALINDTGRLVTVVIDRSLLDTDQVNFHPLVNTESTGLSPEGLLKFIRSCDREPLIIDFDETTAVP